MQFIDVKTVILINILTYFICTFVFFLLWKNNKKRFPAILFLFMDFLVTLVGTVLLFSRGTIPDWISIIIANTIILGGAVIGFIGLERLTGRRGPQIQNAVLIAVFFIVQSYFTFVSPNLTARNINISAVLFIICFQCMWLMLYRVDRQTRRLTFAVGLVYGGYCITNIIRIAELSFLPLKGNDFFKSGGIDTLFLITYMLLFILLTYAVTLMISNYLNTELALEEEKFSKAFHSSPYAITITRLTDGTIFEVNKRFEKKTGYTAQEVIGRTSVDLHLWKNEEDRHSIIQELTAAGHVEEKELCFIKKNGDQMITLYSADIITINGQKAILSSISDITQRKIDEDKIKKLLEEKELLLKEVHHRIKNNMNTIFVLLTLQADAQTNPDTVKALQMAAGRVQSMMVLYYKLYRAENVSSISIREYFPPLIDEIISLFPRKKPVKIIINIDEISIHSNLLSPLGLIINELITNSLKYAFSAEEDGTITVTAHRDNNHVVLTYEDNGAGFKDQSAPELSQGFGMKLIRMLVMQINGSLAYENRIGNGIKYLIEFDI